MQVKDIATDVVETLSPTTSLLDAAKAMRDRDLGWMPVEDLDKVVGIVTDRDMVVRGMAAEMDVKTITVRDVMTKNVLSCGEGDSIDDACDLMEREQVRRLIVLDSDGNLAGVVSLADIAQRGAEDQSAEVLQRVSEPASR